MEPWVWVLIAAFVVSDAIITIVVLRSVRRRKRAQEDPHDTLARDIGLE